MGVAALAGAGPARAASFDCARASRPVERAICADAATAALDARIAETYRRVIATAPWAGETRAAQRAFLARREEVAADPERLRAAHAGRLAALEEEARLADDPRWTDLAEVDLARACLPLPGAGRPGLGCAVTASGRIGTLRGRALHHALYAYRGGETEPGGAMLLLAPGAAPGRLRVVLAASEDDAACEPARLVGAGEAPLLLWRCTLSGSGQIPMDRAWRAEAGGWRALDVTSWQDGLARRLPRDHSLRRGPRVDYARLTATALLQYDGEARRPHMAEARIALAWEGHRLVLRGVMVGRPRE